MERDRPPQPDNLSVDGGRLTITTELGDINQSDTDPPPNNIILQSADHAGENWTIETRLHANLSGGYSQGGLIAYVDDDNYVKVNALADPDAGRINRIQLRSEVGAVVQDPRPEATVPDGTTDIWLRLSKAGQSYTASYSFDGADWTSLGNAVGNPMSEPAFGLFAFGVENEGEEVSFEYFRALGEAGCSCVLPADEFNGAALDRSRWNAIVREDPSLYDVDGGTLWIETSPGDFYESDDPSETTNFILQDASNAGENWTIETKVLGADLHGGYAQGGLIAYVDDDNYVKIDLISPGSRTRPYRIEVRSEIGGLARRPRPQVEPLPEGTEEAWLRLTKLGNVYVPAYSLDGENWTTFSQWVGNPMEDPDFGIFAVGVDEPGTEVGFEYFRFDGEVNCGPDAMAPRTTAALDPELPGPGRTYGGPVQVTLEAVDVSPAETPAAGVAYTEYRVTTNDEVGEWVRADNAGDADPFATSLTLDEPGNHVVQFRSADAAGNVEATRAVSFRIAGGASCFSDEFDGSALHPKWSFVHPTSDEPSVADGSLVYPLGSGELDGRAAGPVAFIGQPIPDGDFEVVAKFTADLMEDESTEGVGGHGDAQAGLMLYQGDDNYMRISQTRVGTLGGGFHGHTFFEVATERNGQATRSDEHDLTLDNRQTWWLRIKRVNNLLAAWYATSDPGQGGAWNEITLSGAMNINTIMPPSNGPIYMGVYGADGSTGVSVDYFRVAPDGDCSGGDDGPGTPGQPELKINAKPKTLKVSRGKRRVAYTVTLRNTGDGAAEGVKVCLKAKKKLVAVKGKACRTVDVPAGEKATARFKLRIKPAARGKKATIKFVVSGAGLEKQTKSVKLQVKR